MVLTATASSIEGCYVAVATPFSGGALDVEVYRKHCESLIAGGVAGLVPCGTTGEAATLDSREYLECVGIAADVAHQAGKLAIAGAGTNATAPTIATINAARAAGADAALVVTPYYNRPSQEGLVLHFRTIAHAIPGFPLVLYNVPVRTGVDLLPATYEQLADIAEIVAVKEATGNIGRVSDIRMRVGERFSLLSGDDLTMLAFVAVGGRGVISVSANVVPALVSELMGSALSCDLPRCRRLNDQLAPLHLALAEGNPVPVKAALNLLGRFADEIRPPLVPAASAVRERIARALAGLGMGV